MLRRQLEATPESVSDFDLAAESRYWDGCQLITQGHGLGAIYLLGYTAEMILKHACFRIDRGRPADPVAGFFGPTRAWMRQHYGTIPTIWSVDLRYRDWTAPAREAQAVYDDVTWLRDTRIRLWS